MCLWIYNIDGMIHGRDAFVSKLFIVKVRCIRVQISLRSVDVSLGGSLLFFPRPSQSAYIYRLSEKMEILFSVFRRRGLIFVSKFDFKIREWRVRLEGVTFNVR